MVADTAGVEHIHTAYKPARMLTNVLYEDCFIAIPRMNMNIL
jgi:hypothetical protein